MKQPTRTSNLDTGALRTWGEVAREWNARTGDALDAKFVRQIGDTALRRLRRWIETAAAVRGKTLNEDDWRV